MEIIVIIWFLIFIKLLTFWLWLWQLKEYRLDRFRAHFEAQAAKKIISSFWRIKHPRFTKKIILILLTCIASGVLFIFYLSFPWAILLTIFFIPLLILFFQAPTFIWRRNIIKKATQKRANFKNLLVIGITGSYGKTSVKEFLATILSSKFKVLSTPAHQNTDTAIAQLILKKLTQDIEIFIVEMAAYKKGEITSPCQIVKPKIGILTGINEQHMATFGSLENIIKTKYELIENLPEDGIAFFNAKNKHCLELYQKTKIKKYLYGESARIFREENILGAVTVAKKLGMLDEEISKAVEKIKDKLPGIQRKKGINDLVILDATYSANPDGVIGHLEYLKNFSGKKVIVMPCLIELGKASKETHKRIGQKIAEICDLAIITTKDRFKEIKEAAGEKAIFLENPEEIFEKIESFLGGDLSSVALAKEDVVLLESRVPNQLISLLVG